MSNAWKPIAEAPTTTSAENPYGRMRAIFYSEEIGINTGELVVPWQRDFISVHIGSFHGNAVEHWGVTHFMPLPAPPETEK